jgi:uncharacterized protein (DUF1800 family)
MSNSVEKLTLEENPMKWAFAGNRIVPVLGLALAAFLAAFAVFPGRTQAEKTDSREQDRAVLLLARATYGPRPGDLEAVLRMGSEAWLERQLHPQRIGDSAIERELDRFTDLELSVRELIEKYPRPSREERERRQKAREAREKGESDSMQSSDERMDRPPGARLEGPAKVLVQLSEAKLLRATFSERQLQEVMTDFWFNHFNVYARKNLPTLLSLPSYEREAIRPHALGKFYDLLVATAQHPAMLHYLDNWTSTREGFDPREAFRAEMSRRSGFGGRRPGRPRAGTARPDDQERRKFGINENYARELLELHTLGVDGGYSQQDVIEVARCLTGWTVINPDMVMERFRSGRREERQPGSFEDGRFHFNAAAHDAGSKTVLGRKITAGGIEDGLTVLKLLSEHPSTARLISTKLAKKFVSDEPSKELVQEMSATFLRTGGDIREVLRAMFRSPRFVAEGAGASKVKTPLELVVSTLRASSAEFAEPSAAPLLARTLNNLGMPLYLCQPPTGYDEEAATWLSAGNMLNRIRFTGELLSGRIRGVRIEETPASVEAWAGEILPGNSSPLSPENAATVREALGELSDLGRSAKVQAMALVLASPAFQRQ